MVSTLLIDNDKAAATNLEQLIIKHCPRLDICGKSFSFKNAVTKIENDKPELIFAEIELSAGNCLKLLDLLNNFEFEIIVLSKNSTHALHALNHCVTGYLLKPIKVDKLLNSVKNAKRRIFEKKANRKTETNMIGIPTIEGFEFIEIS